MTATLGTTGVTGQLYINLSGGESDAPELAANMSIPSTASLFANLSTELPTILASINSVLVRLDKALGEDGQVATIMQDVQKLITSLNLTIAEVGSQTLALLTRTNNLVDKDARRLISELTAAAQATRHVLVRTEPALTRTLESSARAFKQLEQQLANLDLASTNARAQVALQRIAQLAEQLGHTSEEVTLTFQHLRGNTTNAEFHIRQAVRSLRETLRSAKQLFDYLEQDPSALLIGKRAPAQLRDGQQR